VQLLLGLLRAPFHGHYSPKRPSAPGDAPMELWDAEASELVAQPGHQDAPAIAPCVNPLLSASGQRTHISIYVVDFDKGGGLHLFLSQSTLG
jgi:hypothetical protein